MSQLPQRGAFAEAEPSVLTMLEVLARAREALSIINPSPVDSVRSCAKAENGLWRALLDVIEIPARMGDNDLLSTYELTIGPDGELVDFRRKERFYREDRVTG